MEDRPNKHRNYQSAHGLAVDGIVRPIAMVSLDTQFTPTPITPASPTSIGMKITATALGQVGMIDYSKQVKIPTQN